MLRSILQQVWTSNAIHNVMSNLLAKLHGSTLIPELQDFLNIPPRFRAQWIAGFANIWTSFRNNFAYSLSASEDDRRGRASLQLFLQHLPTDRSCSYLPT
jgi:hypothetical protein